MARAESCCPVGVALTSVFERSRMENKPAECRAKGRALACGLEMQIAWCQHKKNQTFDGGTQTLNYPGQTPMEITRSLALDGHGKS